jgi:cob(I)alamin adenosyltransferase
MSVQRKRGDHAPASLARGNRDLTADLRVEAYGAVDELNSTLGFARSLCANLQVCAAVRDIQETVFRVASAVAAPSAGKRAAPLSAADVNRLPEMAHAIRAKGGILPDWSVPGAHIESAAFEMARAVCRRAERSLIRLIDSGAEVDVHALPYIVRLSDMIWLLARQVELDTQTKARARDEKKAGAQ